MTSKLIEESIVAFGHKNIQATHLSTLMFTKDENLSNNGNCIICVSADKAVADLSQKFKNALKKPNAKLTLIIKVGDLAEQIKASGSSELLFTHKTDMVIRKSDYISDRTLAIHADKSSNDLSRALVEKLKNPQQIINITLIIDN